MFHAQTVQQRDQPGPGLIFNAALSRDPGADRAGGAWQGLGDPGFQLILLLRRQPATAAFMVEGRQTFDPVVLIQLIPGPDGVIVEKQHFGDGRTAHPIVQQHQRIGAAGPPVRGRAVTRQLVQVAAGFAVQKARADHGDGRIEPGPVGKRFFRISAESGYSCRSFTPDDQNWINKNPTVPKAARAAMAPEINNPYQEKSNHQLAEANNADDTGISSEAFWLLSAIAVMSGGLCVTVVFLVIFFLRVRSL